MKDAGGVEGRVGDVVPDDDDDVLVLVLTSVETLFGASDGLFGSLCLFGLASRAPPGIWC